MTGGLIAQFKADLLLEPLVLLGGRVRESRQSWESNTFLVISSFLSLVGREADRREGKMNLGKLGDLPFSGGCHF